MNTTPLFKSNRGAIQVNVGKNSIIIPSSKIGIEKFVSGLSPTIVKAIRAWKQDRGFDYDDDALFKAAFHRMTTSCNGSQGILLLATEDEVPNFENKPKLGWVSSRNGVEPAILTLVDDAVTRTQAPLLMRSDGVIVYKGTKATTPRPADITVFMCSNACKQGAVCQSLLKGKGCLTRDGFPIPPGLPSYSIFVKNGKIMASFKSLCPACHAHETAPAPKPPTPPPEPSDFPTLGNPSTGKLTGAWGDTPAIITAAPDSNVARLAKIKRNLALKKSGNMDDIHSLQAKVSKLQEQNQALRMEVSSNAKQIKQLNSTMDEILDMLED